MKHLYKVYKECLKEVEALNIPHGRILSVTPNSRAKNRWGQTRWNPTNNTYIININSQLLTDEAPLIGLKETLIHEILHTCPDCMQHKGQWLKYADIINKAYGYSVKRCNTAEEKGFTKEQAKQMAIACKVEYKYIFKCEKCGGTYGQQRASKFTRHPEWYRCNKCGGKFIQVK